MTSLEEQTEKIGKLGSGAARRVLLFLVGYMYGSNPERNGYCAFVEGLDSGLIEYGDPNDERYDPENEEE